MANVLFQQIRALSVINDEIIERIEGRIEKTTFRYRVKHDSEYNVQVEAIEEKESVGDILDVWKVPVSLDMDLLAITPELHDYLKVDELDWSLVKSLNRLMLLGLDRLEPFLLTSQHPSAEQELRKYLHNFEAIQVELGRVDEMTTSQTNRIGFFAAKARGINDAYKELISALPPLGPFEDSSILSLSHAKTLVNWYVPRNGMYAVKLLYRGSRDGFQCETFHDLCDNQGPTVTVVQTDMGYVFGGYSGVSFTSNGGYIRCTNASLYSMSSPRNLPPTLMKLQDEYHAVYCHASYGPTFGGVNNGTRDLHCSLDSGEQSFCYLGRLFGSNGNQKFRIEELEVFSIAQTSL